MWELRIYLIIFHVRQAFKDASGTVLIYLNMTEYCRMSLKLPGKTDFDGPGSKFVFSSPGPKFIFTGPGL